jgi:hypothetical protein
VYQHLTVIDPVPRIGKAAAAVMAFSRLLESSEHNSVSLKGIVAGSVLQLDRRNALCACSGRKGGYNQISSLVLAKAHRSDSSISDCAVFRYSLIPSMLPADAKPCRNVK